MRYSQLKQLLYRQNKTEGSVYEQDGLGPPKMAAVSYTHLDVYKRQVQ